MSFYPCVNFSNDGERPYWATVGGDYWLVSACPIIRFDTQDEALAALRAQVAAFDDMAQLSEWRIVECDTVTPTLMGDHAFSDLVEREGVQAHA